MLRISSVIQSRSKRLISSKSELWEKNGRHGKLVFANDDDSPTCWSIRAALQYRNFELISNSPHASITSVSPVGSGSTRICRVHLVDRPSSTVTTIPSALRGPISLMKSLKYGIISQDQIYLNEAGKGVLSHNFIGRATYSLHGPISILHYLFRPHVRLESARKSVSSNSFANLANLTVSIVQKLVKPLIKIVDERQMEPEETMNLRTLSENLVAHVNLRNYFLLYEHLKSWERVFSLDKSIFLPRSPEENDTDTLGSQLIGLFLLYPQLSYLERLGATLSPFKNLNLFLKRKLTQVRLPARDVPLDLGPFYAAISHTSPKGYGVLSSISHVSCIPDHALEDTVDSKDTTLSMGTSSSPTGLVFRAIYDALGRIYRPVFSTADPESVHFSDVHQLGACERSRRVAPAIGLTPSNMWSAKSAHWRARKRGH